MEENLRYITFKQFIYTLSIRRSEEPGAEGNDIRIYPDIEGYNKNNWFDLCWYDFFNKSSVWNYLEKILSKDILNSFVDTIWEDSDSEMLCISLVNHPTESLSSLKN